MPSSPHEFFKVFLLSSEYRPNVDRPSTECWPITDRYIGEVSTNYRRSVGEVSVNEKLYRPRHIWNDYGPCLDRVSSDYRPSLDRLSTDYRPLYRVSTDRSHELLARPDKTYYTPSDAVFCFLVVPLFVFFLFLFCLVFGFYHCFSIWPVFRPGHALGSIYILSLSVEFYFGKGISKAPDPHTGQAYHQKRTISCQDISLLWNSNFFFSVSWHHDKQHTIPQGAEELFVMANEAKILQPVASV